MTRNAPHTYRDALQALWRRSGYDRGYVSNPFWGDEAAQLGLRRTAALLHRLGDPHRQYGILHVAGSKGKGSTCAFAAAVLTAAGYRVGRYTSPHLHSFRERIAVDDEPIAEAAFAALTQRALREAERLEATEPALGEVTAFELTTAMALDHFAAVGCDLGVIEVGMGGTLDATNVVTPVVSAITALDFEHTAVLGSTLESIARNKAGIIKPGRPVVTAFQDSTAQAVVEEAAVANGSRLLAAGKDWDVTGTWRSFAATGPWGQHSDLRSGLIGSHQVENAGVALASAWVFNEEGVRVDKEAIRTGLAGVRWPGRFERIVAESGLEIVLDGAHSPASAASLAAAFGAEYPDRRAVVVFGIMADKDPATIARSLAPVAGRWVTTQAQSPRAQPAAEVAAGVGKVGLPVEVAPDVSAAIERAYAVAGASGLVLVTGSLAVVAEAREAMGLARPDPRFEDDSNSPHPPAPLSQ